VIVAEGQEPSPGRIRAFLTAPGQGINLYRNTWARRPHAAPRPRLFAVVDRIGEGANLEEHWLPEPLTVYGSRG
jgi:ureidoglycolate lyase